MHVAIRRSHDEAAAVARRWARENPRADRAHLRGAYALHGKRGLSLVLVLSTAPVWVPVLFALLALNAWAVRGLRQSLFTQDRIGRYGRRFRMYKLRTLRGGEVATGFGRLLRRTHLDELPQLWNVVKGDMCLVGPRPETVAIEAWANRGIPGFSRRLQVRPGITGLAQVRQGHVGPDLEAYREKLRWNDRYLAEVSPRTDLAILARTVTRVLAARGV